MSKKLLHRGVTAEYTSMSELREAYGLKPYIKRTKDENKLNSQREKFAKNHICQGCGKPMEFVGGNVMTCTNPECKGIKIERIDNEGNKFVTYNTSYDILDDKGANIAQNIFN